MSGKKKLISTKRKMTRLHFDTYFNKRFQLFEKTTVIDFRSLNETVAAIIATQNPFLPAANPTGYVSYITGVGQSKLNLNTRKTYSYIVKSFVDFLTTKSLTEIPFEQIKISLFREYKDFLINNGISPGTITYYFVVHKSFLNRAIDDEITDINLPALKKFDLKKNDKKTTILSDDDIKILQQVTKEHHLYPFVQFCLLQLFSNGIRFSDTLLIKYSDFKPDYLYVKILKTKQVLHIPYSPMFVDILYRILGMRYETLLYSQLISHEYFEQTNNIEHNELKRIKIIDHIRNSEDQLLFSIADPLLFCFDKSKNMTPQQYKAYILARNNYNNHLGKLKKTLNLSVDRFSSHSMRYAYTRLALSMGVNIHSLSMSLGHKSVSITELYIRNTFNLDKFEDIGALFANKFKGNKDEDKSDDIKNNESLMNFHSHFFRPDQS